MSKHLNSREEEFSKLNLYHYTSLESLLMIIKNKSLRFTRMDLVNDYMEHKRMIESNQNNFVACFTHSGIESTMMWQYYAKESEGVRLHVPNCDFFTGKIYYEDNTGKHCFRDKVVGETKDGLTIHKIIDTSNGYIAAHGPYKSKVEYDDDKMNKDSFQIHGRGSCVIQQTNVFELCATKTTDWAHEKEARYFASLTSNEQNIKYLYYELNDKFFSNMEILINYFVVDSEYYKMKGQVEDALSNYDVKISRSAIYNMINPILVTIIEENI